MKSQWRNLLKRIEPEGIPWPMSLLYNHLSGSSIFLGHYEMVAKDVRGLCSSGRILDIGTGPGRLLLSLGRLDKKLKLYGADISTAMIEKARENCLAAGAADIDLKVADAASLPYPDEFFDAVVSTGSLHHWKDPASGLNEVHRVLRPGGHALIYDLVKKMPPDVIGRVKQDFGTFRFILLFLHSFEEPFYSPAEMEALAEKTLFKTGLTRFAGALCCLTMKKN